MDGVFSNVLLSKCLIIYYKIPNAYKLKIQSYYVFKLCLLNLLGININPITHNTKEKSV